MKHIPDILPVVRSRRPRNIAVQAQFFADVIEVRVTRDTPFENDDGTWGSMITPPPGRGWVPIDSHRERHTKWQRRTPVVWPILPSSDGWRRR